MTSPAVRPVPTIALVAVHGTGDHEPGAGARAVADLLLRLRAGQGSRYSSFVERPVRIPTKPVRVNPRSAPNVAPDLGRSIFAEQHPFLRTQLQYGGAAARDREEDSPDHQLMRAQLVDYRSTGEPYDTIRLEGERLADAPEGAPAEVQARLHVYDLRWCDLSRPKSTLLRFLAELYQLVFHVAHLGRAALDHARLEHPASALWRSYGFAHTWAVRLVTLFVPAACGAMLMTLACAAVLALPSGAKPYTVAGAAALLAAGLAAAAAYQTRFGRALAIWLSIPAALALVASAFTASARSVILGAVHRVVSDALLVDRLLVAAWTLAAGGIVYLVFRAYERLRPGAVAAGLGAYVLTATPIAFVAAGARDEDELLAGTIHVFEVETIVASSIWSGVYLFGALAGALALTACLRVRGARRSRAWRAARTAAGTLAVSVTLVLAATCLLWTAAYGVLARLLSGREFAAMIPVYGGDPSTYGAFFGRVLEVNAGAGLPLSLIVAAALALAAALTLLPAMITDVRPLRAGEIFGERATEPAAAPPGAPLDTDVLWSNWEGFRREGDASQRLGEWLTRGLRLLGAVVALLYLTVFAIAPGVSAIHWLTDSPTLEPLRSSARGVILAAGGCLVAAVVGLAALRGRLGRLSLGFRPALDVALDIDRYLRTHPRDATPRARIAERYVSLLRYLCHRRDGGGRPYDAIVLVAHSQGAAVTADLLSFIQREEDPELEPLRRPLANGAPGAAGRRLYLFTTGNPLRQLYSEWFPHLFAWVRGERGDGVARPLPAVPREPWMLLPRLEERHRVFAPAIPDTAAPDPYAMGITRWVNAYRSGDYVGRALWRSALDGCDWTYRCAPADAATRCVGDTPPVTYVSEDAQRSRRELCIGAGAHAHYWDATARAIAVELDLLVNDATRAAVRVAKDTGAPAEGMES